MWHFQTRSQNDFTDLFENNGGNWHAPRHWLLLTLRKVVCQVPFILHHTACISFKSIHWILHTTIFRPSPPNLSNNLCRLTHATDVNGKLTHSAKNNKPHSLTHSLVYHLFNHSNSSHLQAVSPHTHLSPVLEHFGKAPVSWCTRDGDNCLLQGLCE